MTKKIDKERSVVCRQWNDPVALGVVGTFVDDFDRPEDYFEGTLVGIRQGTVTSFLNEYGEWYKYFVPADTKVLVDEDCKPFYKLDQLRDRGLMGRYFFIRHKNIKKSAHLVTITEVTLDYRGYITNIGLGTDMFTPEDLFKEYEWIKDVNVEYDWNVFGIKE